MKKTRIFFLIGTIAVLASCSKYEAKTVQLNNVNDSLNYTLGLANGANIKNFYLRNDTTGAATKEFMDALVKSYKSKGSPENNELFELGKNIGSFFKQQEESGLIGDSTLTYNKEIALQGLINGLNNYTTGMSSDEAREYFQKTIQEIRNPKPAPQPAEAEETQANDTINE